MKSMLSWNRWNWVPNWKISTEMGKERSVKEKECDSRNVEAWKLFSIKFLVFTFVFIFVGFRIETISHSWDTLSINRNIAMSLGIFNHWFLAIHCILYMGMCRNEFLHLTKFRYLLNGWIVDSERQIPFVLNGWY